MPRLVDDAPISTRAWAWWLLGATVAACAVVAAFNALVDPTAQLGTGLLDPVAAGPRDRTAKVALLDHGAVPGLVVLGSSRSKKLDPARLDAGARGRGVNAAVVGGDLFEARVLVAHLADRARRRHERFPQVFVGVDVEQFRDSSLQGSGFLDVPALASVARREAGGSDGSVADEVDRLGRLLLTWQTTKASAAAVRARVRGGAGSGGAAAGADGGDPAQEGGTFTPAGVPSGDRAWFRAGAPTRLATGTPARIDAGIEQYTGTYRTIGGRLDPDAVRDLRALVRIAHDAGGPPPILYVTPAHPRLEAALRDRGRRGRLARVRELLADVSRRGAARWTDCSHCIDAADTSWIDAAHPSPLGTRQLAAALTDRFPPA